MSNKDKTISKMHGLEMGPNEFKRFLMQALPEKLPVLVVGKPGIGKTDLVLETAQDLEYDMKVVHPVVSDPTDVKGMPFVYSDKTDGECHANWVPFGDLKDLIEANRPTVCFIDDLGQAPPMVQASWMQPLLFRSINEHKVSDHVRFVAATNRKQDKAGVSGILEPVKSRFCSIIHLKVNHLDWLDWAARSNVAEELIGFVNWKPTILDDEEPDPEIVNQPCPRTLANLDKLIKLKLPSDIERKAYAGAIGPGNTIEFMAFMKVCRELPDPEQALKDPDSVVLPGEDKPDVRWALTSCLALRTDKSNFSNMLELVKRMSVEYSVMAVRIATKRDPSLRKTQAFTTWAIENAENINAG